jgi:hypothetical protein
VPKSRLTTAEEAIPDAPGRRDVRAPAAFRESRALCVVGSRKQRFHEVGDLGPVCRPVCIQRHNDVAAACRAPADERVAFPAARLVQDPDARTCCERNVDGRVH